MAAKGNRQSPRSIKVSDFTNVITGGTPSTRNASYWENGDVPWLPSGVCQDCYVDSAPSFITKEGLDNSAAKMMPPDTILIALTGATAGKVGHLTFTACANQSVTGILPSVHHHPRYLFHYLLKRRKKTLDDCYGGAQPHISQGYVKNIQVPLCSLSEQKRIAAVLDKICELKKNAEAQIENLDLLVKSRFVEMFGKGGFVESRLGEFCEVGSGKRVFADEFKDHGIPFLRGTEISALAKGVYDKPLYYIAEDHYKALAKHTGVPKVGDLLLPSICSEGLVWKVDIDSRFYFKDGRVLWIKVPESVDSEYLRFTISRILKRDYQKVASGTTFAEMKIVNLKKIIVTLPPLALQREFAAFVEKVEKLKDVAKKSVEEMDTLYRAKLQEYFG